MIETNQDCDELYLKGGENEMRYTKPELNIIGVAEGLVLGGPPADRDHNGASLASSAFEFEE
jgi:hypothetical protein